MGCKQHDIYMYMYLCRYIYTYLSIDVQLEMGSQDHDKWGGDIGATRRDQFAHGQLNINKLGSSQ